MQKKERQFLKKEKQMASIREAVAKNEKEHSSRANRELIKRNSDYDEKPM